MEFIKQHYYPHFSNSQYALVVNDHYVYKFHYHTKKFEKYFKIPPANNSVLGKLKDFIARNIVRHFSQHMGLGHVIELPNKVVLVFYDKIYRFDPNSNNGTVEPIFNFKEEGVLPPLRNGIAVTPNGNIYFSEYSNIKNRDTRIISITCNGTKVSTAYTFSGTEIKHAHGIYWDKFRQRLWVTTGDSDDESNFYYTEDEFNTLTHFAGGNQTWRAVSLMFFKDSIAWGMDAGKDAQATDINYIYSLSLNDMKRERVQQIDAPAYHCIQTQSGHYYLGINFEPDCKQAITPEAAIWFSENGKDWEKINQFPYQASPKINGSKYGYIYLPYGEIPDDYCLFTATNAGSISGELSIAQRGSCE